MKVYKFLSLAMAVLFSFLLAACGGGVEKETVYLPGATNNVTHTVTVTSVINNTVTVTVASNNTPPPGTDVSVLPNSCDPNVKDVVAGEKKLTLICFRLSTNSPVSSFAIENSSGSNLENVFNFSSFVLRKVNSPEAIQLSAYFEDGLLVLDFPQRFYANSQNGFNSGDYYLEASLRNDIESIDIGKIIQMKFFDVQTYSANKKVFIGDDVKGNQIKIIQDPRFDLPTVETASVSELISGSSNYKSFTFKCEATADFCLLDKLSMPSAYNGNVTFYDGNSIIYPRFSYDNEKPWDISVNLNLYAQPGTTKEIKVIVQTAPALPTVGPVYTDYFYIYDIEANVSGRIVTPKIKNSDCGNFINDGNCKG